MHKSSPIRIKDGQLILNTSYILSIIPDYNRVELLATALKYADSYEEVVGLAWDLINLWGQDPDYGSPIQYLFNLLPDMIEPHETETLRKADALRAEFMGER